MERDLLYFIFFIMAMAVCFIIATASHAKNNDRCGVEITDNVAMSLLGGALVLTIILGLLHFILTL